MTWGIDNDYGPPPNPALQKARWEQIEYPAILRQARELDRRRGIHLRENCWCGESEHPAYDEMGHGEGE